METIFWLILFVILLIIEILTLGLTTIWFAGGALVAFILAFVGFDLLYLSTCLMFFNIPLLLVSMWAALMLHLQILQEEQHMLNMFGGEYEEYKKHTLRYFGRR